jgi:mevalonate kinase
MRPEIDLLAPPFGEQPVPIVAALSLDGTIPVESGIGTMAALFVAFLRPAISAMVVTQA